MYGTQRALSAYKTIGVETGVESADPHRLVLMLFDGAMIAIGDARRHLAAGGVAERGASISKAIAIIENGLKASLDRAAGGELADRLAALYDYMRMQLLKANLGGSDAPLAEVQQLLGELREAWAQVGQAAPRARMQGAA
jgi:flagellar protein FliS